MAFAAFDLNQWAAASDDLRRGNEQSTDLLHRHARKLCHAWHLPGREGAEELASCAALLPRDERERRSQGTVLDNRAVWARILDENFATQLARRITIVPQLVRIYLCAVDGTGQVERDLGGLRKILDSHVGLLDEDGETISWLAEVYADGPTTETELGTRLEASVPDGPVALEATDFTRACAEMWLEIHGRRFRLYHATRKNLALKPNAQLHHGRERYGEFFLAAGGHGIDWLLTAGMPNLT